MCFLEKVSLRQAVGSDVCLAQNCWYHVLGTKYLVPSTLCHGVASPWYQELGRSCSYQVLVAKYLAPGTCY